MHVYIYLYIYARVSVSVSITWRSLSSDSQLSCLCPSRPRCLSCVIWRRGAKILNVHRSNTTSADFRPNIRYMHILSVHIYTCVCACVWLNVSRCIVRNVSICFSPTVPPALPHTTLRKVKKHTSARKVVVVVVFHQKRLVHKTVWWSGRKSRAGGMFRSLETIKSKRNKKENKNEIRPEGIRTPYRVQCIDTCKYM